MSTLPETQQRLAFVERENRELRKKLEQIEREHKDLKRAYFQLSLRQKNDKDSGQDMFPMREADEALDDHVINTHVRNEVVGPAWGSEETSTPNNIKGSDEPRSLVCQATLEGHLGAVYTAKFSRKGTYLASGSFDKTVRLWSLSWDEGIVTPRDVATLSDHTLNVSDVSWAHDDSFLVSGAYDKSVKCWDISATRAVSTYDLGGFVLAVGCVPNDVNLIWAASSQGSVYLFDRRSSAHVLMLSNDGGMVNGLDLSSCGTRLFTGDSKGQIRCWCVCVYVYQPICTFHISQDICIYSYLCSFLFM
jgi:WD40 repeat protein